jgi:hypothetical protein
MRWSQPYFNVEAYRQGKHCSSTTCCVNGCTNIAITEYCETGQSQPNNLDIWYPLCREHSSVKVPNWRETIDNYLHTIIDFDAIDKCQTPA